MTTFDDDLKALRLIGVISFTTNLIYIYTFLHVFLSLLFGVIPNIFVMGASSFAFLVDMYTLHLIEKHNFNTLSVLERRLKELDKENDDDYN